MNDGECPIPGAMGLRDRVKYRLGKPALSSVEAGGAIPIRSRRVKVRKTLSAVIFASQFEIGHKLTTVRQLI